MHSVTELRCASMYYGLAIFQHFIADFEIENDAAWYIHSQCHFVHENPEKVWRFLRSRGVKKLSWKHLQYFFSIEPPVYEPYQELWFFCFDGMKADGSLPKNGKETLMRLLKDKRRGRSLYSYAKMEGVKCSTN